MKKLDLTPSETERLATAITKLGWELVRPLLVSKALERLTGRKFGYVDCLVLDFLAQSLGYSMEAGRRSQAEASDRMHGV